MAAEDKSDLFSNDKSVAFRQWRFSVREVLLVVLVILGVFLFMLFAGLYGREASNLKATTSALTEATRERCSGRWCFETMGHVESFLNKSYDPCDNFFRFACGGYKVARELDPGRQLYNNIFQEMRQNNEAILKDILVSGRLPQSLNKSSSERKLKDFYSSCMDDFTKEQLKAKPFIDKVIPLLGGSYIVDRSWNSATWNLGDALSKVQTDLWVDAIFAPRVVPDQTNWSQRIIAIYPGGAGRYMDWSDYVENPTPTQKQLQDDYKKFMRTVATLLARDAGAANNQDLSNRLDVFVDDAYQVEAKIAKFASNARYQRDAYSDARKMTLDDLKQQTGNVIDWTAQMSYLFNGASVTGSTKVVIPYPTYLTNITSVIQSLDDNARMRMLHNYLSWRVLEIYIQDLSWDYVHANRQVYVDKFGPANFLGTAMYCYRLAKIYFNIALGTLYVNTAFERRNKVKVTDITETVKTALENLINSNNWMDRPTKDYAIDKMKKSTYKIGYPDFMDDVSKVDAIYDKLDINSSDFFSNLLAGNQQYRREWNRKLAEGEDRSEWVFSTYMANLAVYWYWDEIIVPAGILQFPMYMYDMPHYYSFGSIGTLLGRFIHYLIDEQGRRWDSGGDYIRDPNGWWSNQTVQNYNIARQCVANVYNNVTQGPYTSANGEEVSVSVDGDSFAWHAMAITTGIRLAYNAYQLWQQKNGQDPYPAGLQLTPDQLFFVGHAQTFCYNRDPTLDYVYNVLYEYTNEETRVNVALMELPEFQQTFGCQTSDKMVSAKPCTYY